MPGAPVAVPAGSADIEAHVVLVVRVARQGDPGAARIAVAFQQHVVVEPPLHPGTARPVVGAHHTPCHPITDIVRPAP